MLTRGRRLGLAVACSFAQFSAALAEDAPPEARQFREAVEGKNCIEKFETQMNDPSSFQLATPFSYNGQFTRMENDSNQTLAFYGYDKVVAFSASIREKNEYGGLVLKNLTCEFGIKPDSSLVLVHGFETD